MALSKSINYLEIIPSDTLSHILHELPITLSYLLRKVCKRFCNTVLPLQYGYRLLVLHCAKYGYLNILKFFHSAHDTIWIREGIDDWFNSAGRYTWLKEFDPDFYLPSWQSIISSEAAYNGNTCLLLWMEQNYAITFDKLTLIGALRGNKLDLASMINEKLPVACDISQAASESDKYSEYDHLICTGAASDKIEILIWLEDNKIPIDPPKIYRLAMFYNNMSVVEYVFSKYNNLYILDEIDENTFENAVDSKNMDMFNWITQYPILLNSNCIKHCAGKAHIPATEYVIARGFPWQSSVTTRAISSGNTDYIQWAYDKGYIKLKAKLYYHATNLQVLEWLDKMHCPKDANPKNIEVGANLPMMKHMYAAGFKLSTSLIEVAIMDNDIDVITWLHKNNCPYKDKYLNHAIQEGYDDLVIRLLQLGYKPTSDSIEYAILYGKTKLIERFIRLGVKPDCRACTYAAASGCIAGLRVLLSYNCPYNREEMLQAANESKKHDMIEWIKNNMVGEEPAQKRMRFE